MKLIILNVIYKCRPNFQIEFIYPAVKLICLTYFHVSLCSYLFIWPLHGLSKDLVIHVSKPPNSADNLKFTEHVKFHKLIGM